MIRYNFLLFFLLKFCFTYSSFISYILATVFPLSCLPSSSHPPSSNLRYNFLNLHSTVVEIKSSEGIFLQYMLYVPVCWGGRPYSEELRTELERQWMI